ncbi:ankyrin [Coprinopsis marcescibilis]|uniref:Ankyrin n=1 Tax=Coprinopsis marcescibilis TaxID=230819 RepID=A0A5C3LL41_COPMA|nr:ankyrin [Coprinopsis marcescibilis]
MAEKDPTARLRRAVKENNLFLVKRLIQRTDMRNPDVAPRRYTSLAWAAVMGHEETFEFLLSAGHDERELSKDFENNTILMLLADQKPPPANPYSASSTPQDTTGAALRMARLYYDRYPWTLDWSNVHGKTALHIAALRGNEELVRMLCDLGADVNLADNLGNTPLHYASAWGHVTIVQLLIERGCQYTAKNNENFTALDYAYSFSTREALQESVRRQFELNKEKRRHIFAQAAARGTERSQPSSPIPIPPPVPTKDREIPPRLRSGSGTSRTTATSDSGDIDVLTPGQASFISSSPSHPSTTSSSLFANHRRRAPSTSNGYAKPLNPSNSLLSANSPNSVSGLNPIATRMRERDADAMEKFRRNRSGSSSTDNNLSVNGSTNGSGQMSAGLSPNAEEFQRGSDHLSGSMTPRRLRPSFSAAQLRTTPASSAITTANGAPHSESRTRSGTNPTSTVPPLLKRSPSISSSLRSMISPDRASYEDPRSYMGPPSQYAQFPEPPKTPEGGNTPTVSSNRRKGLHILGKPLSGFDSSGSNHRRGMSATSVRGS